MKIATYNVNGVNGRLEILLRWLELAEPDVVCLQELKAPDTRFPAREIEAAGYGAVWHGQKSWNGVAILAKGEPLLTRKGLPGNPDDTHSRYIEAAVDGMVIGCLYLPNGNPYPGAENSSTSSRGFAGLPPMPPNCSNWRVRWFSRVITTCCRRNWTSTSPSVG